MNEFDRKIREISKEIKVPEEYNEKVETLLNALPEKEFPKRSRMVKLKRAAVLMVCLVCAVILFRVGTLPAKANVFENFKTTILDFIGGNSKETSKRAGVESKKTSVADKRTLRMELQETVVSSHEIYLLIRITASTDVEFTEDIGFEYFAFSKGESFNSNDLLGGAIDCKLLEVMEGKSNIALYAVTLSSDEQIEDGGMVTAYFENLSREPFSDTPDIQVEGVWSISFSTDYTVRDEISIDGIRDVEIPFLNTTADIERITLNPLGMMVVADVSRVPYDSLGISDTTIEVRLKMMDGTEVVVESKKEVESIIESGSRSYDTIDGKTTQTNVYQFETVLDINKVTGIYIEDRFIPVD